MAIADFAGGMLGMVRQRMLDQLAQQEMANRTRQIDEGAALDRDRLTQQGRQFDQAHGLDVERFRASQQPEPEQPISVGGRLVMPSGQVAYEPPPEPDRPMLVSPGSQLVDPGTGRIISRAPTAPPAANTDRQRVEYQDATGRNVVEYLTDDEVAGRKFNTPAPNTGAANRQKALDEVSLLEQQLQDILTYGEQNQWGGVGGVFEGSAKRLAKQWLGVGPDESEMLRNKIGNLRTDIAHEKFGSAFTGGEKAMLNTFAPDIDRDPSAIKANIENLLIEARRKKAQLSGAGPMPTGDTGGAGPTAMVAMMAPDGRQLNVPAEKVAELEALGAKRR